MKKFILLTSVLAITGSAIAQKTSFGIKGGIQQTAINLNAEEGDTKLSYDGPRLGFILGGTADIKFTSHFSVQPNLLFVYKPGRALLFDEGDISTMSIDVPVNLLYNYNGFFIGAGPNFSYGVSSKYKPFDDSEEEVDLYEEVDGEDAFVKRFEIGANAVMGFNFPSGVGVAVNYTRGLSNILNSEAEGDINMNYRQFGISLTYLFKKK